MTDKPILFSAAMIRALLDGRKTQTRRVLCAADPSDDAEEGYRDFPLPYVAFGAPVYENPEDGNVYRFRRTYAIGDRLWVREAHAFDGPMVRYCATDDVHELRKKRPSIHMPRWASRLTLTVTDVRVQRVQEISEADALAEGICASDVQMYPELGTARHHFEDLWDSLNYARGYGWDANPWVAAYTFTVARQNIDQVAA